MYAGPGGISMRIRMYNMNALNAFISRMTTEIETSFTNFNVSTPQVKFMKESTVIEYKISNVDGLESISFDIDNGDFGLWVILTQNADSNSKVTFKHIEDFDEKLDKIKNNNMLKMQLECIKRGVINSIE
jgi:hypothetical protein